ncbi:YdeI family protein [Streptomyces sp. NBRC 110035]|uniref:YdeI/OmpD-associated family protein n=1 Tax=Streptomyces sp. NBRC 110035 TaxID=1547867 RepID=UPI0005A706D1|nr:YdeI/OmpD-associated family protein [Streptomyces sp. NBRC 110035]
MSEPIIFFEDQTQWEQWLEEHHGSASGVWVKIAKNATGIPSVTYAEALDCAICFGWIDSQRDKVDDQYWQQRFTPRTKKSPWSQANRERVERLAAAGAIRPAGQREIDAAKADGRWEAAYASQSKMTVPDDFEAALREEPAAAEFFATLDSKNRYAILYRIQSAKKTETRVKRIEKFVTMMSNKEKIYS